jgi:FkbM family methyltransferase
MAGGRVFSPDIGLDFLGNDLVSRGFGVLREAAWMGFKASREPFGLMLRNGDLALRLTRDEEIGLFREIFLERCYHFQPSRPCHVLDVGANVGWAGLSFAQAPWTLSVTGFEPFEATADAWEANVALNSHLRPKMTLNRWGLSDADQEFGVDYVPRFSACMQISGLAGWKNREGATTMKVKCAVRRASSELERLWPTFGSEPVMAKIDCEGSEYAILEDLASTGWLRRLEMLIIEWHDRGPESLAQILIGAGFCVRIQGNPRKPLGLILAWRKAC